MKKLDASEYLSKLLEHEQSQVIGMVSYDIISYLSRCEQEISIMEILGEEDDLVSKYGEQFKAIKESTTAMRTLLECVRKYDKIKRGIE